MGAVLEKERVVREEDLSEYLKSQDAQATYLQKPLNDNYALLSYLNRTFLKLPSNDEYLLKSSANNLFQPKDNYVSLKDFNNYKTTSNTTYQPKGDYQPSGNYQPSGDYLTKTVSDGLYQPKGMYSTLNTSGGLNLTGSSNIANLNISGGFNAPLANSNFYKVNIGSGGINSTGNITAGQTLLGTWSGGGNFSYFGNKNVANANQYGIIQLNNGDTYISGNTFVKIGPNNNQALTVDNNGNLCIGPTCINSTQLATMKSKLGI